MRAALNNPGHTVVPERLNGRIDVFVNAAGSVTLRQPDPLGEDQPEVIVIRPADIDAVVQAMLRARAEAIADNV